MYFSHDNKTKLLELLKKDGKILPNEREKIAQKIEQMTDLQIGDLLKEIVEGHFDISDIEEEMDKPVAENAPVDDEKPSNTDDYSRKGEIDAMRKSDEKPNKPPEAQMEITPEDLK